MARMTPAEATSVNILIGYLAGKGEPLPDEVARSLHTLASRAYNRLQSGWHEDAVTKQWPNAFVRGTPAQDGPGAHVDTELGP